MCQGVDQKYKKKVADAEHEQRLNKLEEEMTTMSLDEEQKAKYREILQKAEEDMSRRLTTNDFEPLTIIGRGAFGEVRLVRKKDSFSKEVYGWFGLV